MGSISKTPATQQHHLEVAVGQKIGCSCISNMGVPDWCLSQVDELRMAAAAAERQHRSQLDAVLQDAAAHESQAIATAVSATAAHFTQSEYVFLLDGSSCRNQLMKMRAYSRCF